MGWIRMVILAALVSPGCAAPPQVVEQGEALLDAGKLEQAADRFAAACAVVPDRADCVALDRRAAEARIAAAEHAMAEGRYLSAERLLLLATLSESAPARDRAAALLHGEELATGRRQEIALALPDKQKTLERMLAITRDKRPPNAATRRAAAWIEKERPAMLAADVEAACKPGSPPGASCTAAYAALIEATGSGPDAASALARAEAARVYPLRVRAEQMLGLYVAYGRADRRLAECMVAPPTPTDAAPDGGGLENALAACQKTVFPGDAADNRARHDRAFHDLLVEIGDAVLVRELAARRERAIAEGKVDRITIEKPPAAPQGVKP